MYWICFAKIPTNRNGSEKKIRFGKSKEDIVFRIGTIKFFELLTPPILCLDPSKTKSLVCSSRDHETWGFFRRFGTIRANQLHWSWKWEAMCRKQKLARYLTSPTTLTWIIAKSFQFPPLQLHPLRNLRKRYLRVLICLTCKCQRCRINGGLRPFSIKSNLTRIITWSTCCIFLM